MWKTKIDKADQVFSLYIRELAEWKCEYCGKDYSDNHQGLNTSHYFSRGKEATRFDPDNANAFCFYHHQWLGHGDGRDEYKAFKIKQLGENGFKLLQARAFSRKKKDRKMSFIIIKALLYDLLGK